MFAIQTDHAANLSRHVDDHMTWTYKKTVSVQLAWIGFDDSHSNIRHYSINIGSGFFSSDLNQVRQMKLCDNQRRLFWGVYIVIH
jgi:hypothetical protein